MRFPMAGQSPEDYVENMAKMKAVPEGFTILKQAVGFHSAMAREVPNYFYGEPQPGGRHPNRGLMTEQGLKHI